MAPKWVWAAAASLALWQRAQRARVDGVAAAAEQEAGPAAVQEVRK